MSLADRFEALVEAHDHLGSPLRQALRPGLPRDEVLKRLAAIGVVAPGDLVTWFGLFDGVHPARASAPASYLIPYWTPLGLEEAVRQAVEMRALATDLARRFGVDAMDYWRPDWVPLATYGQDQLVLDCADPTGPVVWWVSWEPSAHDTVMGPICPSLEAWLGAVVGAFAAGHYLWDDTLGELDWSKADGDVLPRCTPTG